MYVLYEAGEKYLPYIIQSQKKKYNIEPGPFFPFFIYNFTNMGKKARILQFGSRSWIFLILFLVIMLPSNYNLGLDGVNYDAFR